VGGLHVAAGPLFGKQFIDAYLLPRALDWTTMALLIAGYLLTGIAASLLRYVQLVRLAGLATRSVLRLRESVYAHVLRLPMAFFDRAITGQLVSRITNDTEAVKRLYTQVLFEVLVGLTVLFGVIVAMLWLDWRLMLLVLVLVPATIGIVWGYQRLSAEPVARARALRSDINARVDEGIAGKTVLQAMGAVPRFCARFADTNGAHYVARMGEVRAKRCA
jgi:ATP-binding cassette subfamily B protein/ATP-binding cassette subfamily C protein/ATP-binding cassette subfamily B multidrug efflux pump